MNRAQRNRYKAQGSRLKAQGKSSCLEPRAESTFSLQRCHAQITVETAVLFGFVIAGFIGMSVYVQRAYQGYLYSTASTHGPQFEPNNRAHPYLEVQELTNSYRVGSLPGHLPKSGPAFRQIQEVTVSSEADSSGSPRGAGNLPAVPGGELPGRILKTEIDVTTDWNVNRRACYGDTTPCE